MAIKVRKSTWLTLAVLLAGLLYLIFEPQLQKKVVETGAFNLTETALESFNGHQMKIPAGYRGYFLFYSPYIDCTTCIRRLAETRHMPKSYPDVGYFAILRGEEGKQHFSNLLAEYEIPGEILLDSNERLATRLGLAKHPFLLLFDRHAKLIVALPLDLEQPELEKQLYRYLEEI